MFTARFVIGFYDRENRTIEVCGVVAETNAHAVIQAFESTFDAGDWEQGQQNFDKLKEEINSGNADLQDIEELFDEFEIDFNWKFADDLGI